MKRKRINFHTRLAVFRRDSWRCVYCSKPVYLTAPKDHASHAVIDHFESFSSGGADNVSNFVTACFKCNAIKGKKVYRKPEIPEFRKPRRGGSQVVKGKNMKYTDTYKSESNFLKYDDLDKKRVALTILNVEQKTIGDDTKLVLAFKETPKQLVLNVTNCRMLEMLTGSDDTDHWLDKKIILRPDITNFQGKPTPCIRIDSELPEQIPDIPTNRGRSVDIPF